MGLDRFVRWKKRKPTAKEVRQVLEDYLGGVGTIKNEAGRLFAMLPGTGSHPLKRMTKIPEDMHRKDRWFEVYISKHYLDVITRQHDAFTNSLAAGYAEVMARWWEGKLED